ncbi:hypothetical protein ACFX15_019257 [Malus domestica]
MMIFISEFRKGRCSPDIRYLSRAALKQSSCSQVAAINPRPRNRRSPTLLRILIRRPIEPQLELTDSVVQALQEQFTPKPLDSPNHPVRKKRHRFDRVGLNSSAYSSF